MNLIFPSPDSNDECIRAYTDAAPRITWWNQSKGPLVLTIAAMPVLLPFILSFYGLLLLVSKATEVEEWFFKSRNIT